MLKKIVCLTLTSSLICASGENEQIKKNVSAAAVKIKHELFQNPHLRPIQKIIIDYCLERKPLAVISEDSKISSIIRGYLDIWELEKCVSVKKTINSQRKIAYSSNFVKKAVADDNQLVVYDADSE